MVSKHEDNSTLERVAGELAKRSAVSQASGLILLGRVILDGWPGNGDLRRIPLTPLSRFPGVPSRSTLWRAVIMAELAELVGDDTAGALTSRQHELLRRFPAQLRSRMASELADGRLTDNELERRARRLSPKRTGRPPKNPLLKALGLMSSQIADQNLAEAVGRLTDQERAEVRAHLDRMDAFARQCRREMESMDQFHA